MSYLSEYGESHQTTFNKRVHYICVPAIFFSLIGLLACIPTGGFLVNQPPTWMASFLHFGILIIILGLTLLFEAVFYFVFRHAYIFSIGVIQNLYY